MSARRDYHKKKILVTGGAGYIGSHLCLALLQDNFNVVVLDNFDNSSPESLRRVELLSNKTLDIVKADVRDAAALDQVFQQHEIAAVLHLAGLKAVGESVLKPAAYYDCNVYGSLVLAQAMQRARCQTIIFSSTATVYGNPDCVPLTEEAPLRTTNSYAATKLAVEEMLVGFGRSDPNWRCLSLRYFNPVGAHPSGRIGEDPNGIPNNLFPFIAQVAVGRRKTLNVFGSDYETQDGTGVRDYIHVVDLAEAHLLALKYLLSEVDENKIPRAVNLGTGIGYSVLDCLEAWRKATGKNIPYQFVDRRPGDVPSYFADASLAADILGWTARQGLAEMCADHWRWQQENPLGYNAN